MDQAVTRAAGATPSTTLPAAAAPRLVGEFQGYVDGIVPSVRWLDRKNMPNVGDKLFLDPARAAGIESRMWSILLTSANHGVVGPLGHVFKHAGEHHERVVVVEVPAGAGAPSDQVNLVMRAASAAQDEPEIFPDWISYDAIEHTLTMHGVVYSAELFKTLGIAPVGESFTIAARNNGVLTLARSQVAAQAGQVAVPENISRLITDSIADCGHRIDEKSVTLYADPKQEGNALSQLADRIEAALRAAPAQAKPLPADFRNVTAVKRISDQSLILTFASCASCSKFEQAAAPSPAKESK